jgi:thiamine pyrophosphate-dependent acetolactate synthase large subunit-like protein
MPSSTDLLEKTQAMIEVERLLTITLEKVEPWLKSNNNTQSLYGTSSRNYFNHNAVRVRPIPTTMEEVDEILAIARNLSTRTSAPAGWNPNAPVVGFSTPNPLPHQLRGGALAALELQRARQQQKAEQDQKKRKRQEEEENAKKLQRELEEKAKQNNAMVMDDDSQPGAAAASATSLNDPKAVDAASHRPLTRSAGLTAAVGARTSTQQQRVTAATMNLSDSSSSDDDDDKSD